MKTKLLPALCNMKKGHISIYLHLLTLQMCAGRARGARAPALSVGRTHVFISIVRYFMGFARPCKGARKLVCNWRQESLHCWRDMARTMSWECWKHPFGIPGVRPMFLKAELHKESKNGFKTINYRRSPVMFFSKKLILAQKNCQKIGCFVDFWIFMAIYINKLYQY